MAFSDFLISTFTFLFCSLSAGMVWISSEKTFLKQTMKYWKYEFKVWNYTPLSSSPPSPSPSSPSPPSSLMILTWLPHYFDKCTHFRMFPSGRNPLFINILLWISSNIVSFMFSNYLYNFHQVVVPLCFMYINHHLFDAILAWKKKQMLSKAPSRGVLGSCLESRHVLVTARGRFWRRWS